MASDDLHKALKDARVAALFAAACVVLVGVLLMIDGQRNKWMAQQMDEVRRIFAAIQGMAVSDAEGTAAPSVVGGPAGDDSRSSGEPAPGLEPTPPAGEGQPAVDGTPVRSPNGQFARRASAPGGPRGNG